MRDEIKRISVLVAEGKLSPEDAADLIDAFYAADRSDYGYDDAGPQGEAAEADVKAEEPGAKRTQANRDPLKSIVESIEKLTKDGIDSVNWGEVSKQARSSAKKGFDALKTGIEDISKGKVNLGWLFTSESKEVSLPLSLAPGKTLKVENLCGDIKIVGGAVVGSATAHARFRGQSAEDTKLKSDAYTFIIEESDHMVVIKQPDVSGLQVDLEILMPGKGPVEVRSDNGDVDVADTGGSCRIHCRSGNISVRGLDGVVEITSENGRVSVEDAVTASLAIENKNGSISIARVRGNINARTASGNLHLTSISGKTISLESVSGNVEVDLTEPVTGSLNVRTVSGNASLGIPDGSDCRVSLSTLRGNVTCGLELEDDAKQDQRITGRLGAGTGALDVSAVTGNVTVNLRDAVAA